MTYRCLICGHSAKGGRDQWHHHYMTKHYEEGK